jgi:hypothetical protein
MAAVLLRMQFCSLRGMMSCVLKMSMGDVGVVGSFFVIASFVVFGCFFVVMGGTLVMLSGIVVMLCCFFRHLALLQWFVNWAILGKKTCRLVNMGYFAGRTRRRTRYTLHHSDAGTCDDRKSIPVLHRGMPPRSPAK